jgi:MFS family permease
VGAFTAGQLARRLGRVKIILQTGLGTAAVGFLLLTTTIQSDSSGTLAILYMALIGAGIGVCMPTALVTVQNAADHSDIGSATGAFLFLRSMGGAVGSTLAGVLLAGQFARHVAASGIAVPIDMGALRVHEGAAVVLDAATRLVAQGALSSAFHIAFLGCAALEAGAFITCWGLRDLPLRSAR